MKRGEAVGSVAEFQIVVTGALGGWNDIGIDNFVSTCLLRLWWRLWNLFDLFDLNLFGLFLDLLLFLLFLLLDFGLLSELLFILHENHLFDNDSLIRVLNLL